MNPACPACSAPTRLVQLRNVECFECADCRGHCIRGTELERFLTDRDAPQRFFDLMRLAGDSSQSQRVLTCPDCRAKSFHVVRTCFIEVDLCSICVCMYLDKGEARAWVLRTHASTKVAEQAVDGVESLLEEISDAMED